jgi:hypothetical protein
MPVTNPSFESGTGGLPTGWTLTASVTGPLYATFAETSGFALSAEAFSVASWGSSPYISVVTGENGLFDAAVFKTPVGHDSFSRWSGNNLYIHGFMGLGVAADFGAEAFGDASWVGDYTDSVTDSPAITEDFGDASWNGSQPAYLTEVSGGDAATFTYGSTSVESFYLPVADVVFVPDPVADKCLGIAPVMQLDDKVTMYAEGRLASGFAQNQIYYVVELIGSYWRLGTQVGGAHIDITDVGSGSQFVRADPKRYWTLTE